MTNLIYVGFIKKTHGFKGVVKIHVENSDIILKQKEPLMLEINKKPVPFFIEQISKTDTEWQVKFEDIRNVEEAEEIVGLSVYIESGANQPEEVWSNNTEGFKVFDKQLGPIGEVTEHIHKPGQDMLEVLFNSKTFYIPFVEEIIIDFDNEKEIIYTDLPEGLININD
ncbi:MAG: ribosome maturation factor RimM [Bacteroidia bacterium]